MFKFLKSSIKMFRICKNGLKNIAGKRKGEKKENGKT
jgi:hypothetical protein